MPITQIPRITVQTISLLTHPHPSPIIERMSDTKAEQKPPTLADIVREKTDDGRRIIDFFLDVMEDRIDGAELCHRIDAAKQLEKHKSKAAAKFLAKYRGVSCGHSINGRPNPADPCSAEERSLVAVTLNAPATLTKDFLTVLSGIDEFLMARLIRAQTADGGTVIEFLDDVMQDRNDGFKTHHRIAAAKELIVHIVRDEQPDPTPREPAPAKAGGPAQSLPRTRYGAGTHPVPLPSVHPEPVEGPDLAKRPEPNSTPTPPEPAPAKSLPRTRYGAGTHPPACPEPVLSTVERACPEPVEGSQLETNNSKLETLPARQPRTRRTRTQRRRDGAARAAIRRKALGSERIQEEKDEKPAPVELTPAERRIKERLEQHWHEPDPWAAPIDSTHPGRSPPW